MDDINIIDLIEQFINKINILKKLKGICIITIAMDKLASCSCFIFNYDTKEMLKHYPQRYETNNPIYKTINNKNFTINLVINLPLFTENGEHSGIDEDMNYYPFCCKNCKKTTNNKLSNEIEFDNFINKKNSSKYLFNITKKIQFGPLIFTPFNNSNADFYIFYCFILHFDNILFDIYLTLIVFRLSITDFANLCNPSNTSKSPLSS